MSAARRCRPWCAMKSPSRSFDQANNDAGQIMESVKQKAAAAYFAAVGITLDFVGWADTFTFDQAVQEAVNRRYIASRIRRSPHCSRRTPRPFSRWRRRMRCARSEHTDGRLPTTIVGLPPDLGGLMGTLLRAAPVPGQLGQAGNGGALRSNFGRSACNPGPIEPLCIRPHAP